MFDVRCSIFVEGSNLKAVRLGMRWRVIDFEFESSMWMRREECGMKNKGEDGCEKVEIRGEVPEDERRILCELSYGKEFVNCK